MGVFSMMRLLPVALIVFVFVLTYVCDPNLQSVEDNAMIWLDKITSENETWPIYCCTGNGGVAEETCGDGIDCCTVCQKHGGKATDCVAFLYGENQLDQASQHCKQANLNPNYCHEPGYIPGCASYDVNGNCEFFHHSASFACASLPAIDARHCSRRIRNRAQMRRMQCPCCLHKSKKKEICGDGECPC